MAEPEHKYFVEITHEEMLTNTYALSAALGIVIENTLMFEKGVKHLTDRYLSMHDHRIAIATLIEKLNAVHQTMKENGECQGLSKE